MLKRLKVRTSRRGVHESVWVLGFCSSRPQHIVREWLAAHNLWPRLVVATQTRVPPPRRPDVQNFKRFGVFPIYPLSFQFLPDTPTQRPLINPFAINSLRTLFIATGGVLPPSSGLQLPMPYSLSTISFLFKYVRTLFHFFALFCAYQKLNSFLFKRFRTLCKKHPGWGWGHESGTDRAHP